MVYRPGQFTRLLAITQHRSQQAAEPAADGCRRRLLGVGKNLRGLMAPRKPTPAAGPMRCRFVQAAVDQLLQFLELAREPLFSATRSRLWEMCVNRSRSLRPAATSGGRPSSVIALRTAAQ